MRNCTVLVRLLVTSLTEDTYGQAQQKFSQILQSFLAAELQLIRFIQHPPGGFESSRQVSLVRSGQIVYGDPDRLLKGKFWCGPISDCLP